MRDVDWFAVLMFVLCIVFVVSGLQQYSDKAKDALLTVSIVPAGVLLIRCIALYASLLALEKNKNRERST